MKVHPDGTVEGTPEELAAYGVARTRLDHEPFLPFSSPTVPVPKPWKTSDPWPGDPAMCDQCARRVAQGKMVVCGCTLAGRGVTC